MRKPDDEMDNTEMMFPVELSVLEVVHLRRHLHFLAMNEQDCAIVFGSILSKLNVAVERSDAKLH